MAIDAVPERFGASRRCGGARPTERAEEQNYCKRSPREQPIADTHMFGAMTLRAASDCLRGLAELFDSGHPLSTRT